MTPTPAYTHHNGTLCIVGSTVIGEVVSKPLWDKWSRTLGLVQRGGNGRPSLIAWERVPAKHRARIVEAFGEPQVGHPPSGLEGRLKPDTEAATYYSTIMTERGALSPARQLQYTANAMVMNALIDAQDTERKARQAHGKGTGDFWGRASAAVNRLPKDVGHNLPANPRALKRKVDDYREARKVGAEHGYASLVHGGVGKQNALKVTDRIERLIVSIATMPTRPFTTTVHEYLMAFMAGNIEVFDSRTGEQYEPAEFTDAKGRALEISEATVWNYVQKNATVIDSLTMGTKRFNDTNKPYHHRHAPVYAFSKVTMDDRDLPRLMADGNRVKAYYCYDVASGAVIGASYSRSKDESLFIDCLRDMLRFIDAGQYGGIPHEVEVEHHLVSSFKDQLESVFPRVRWCRPGNSQEKSAEHFNRSKKMTVEKRNHAGIGRWWAQYSRYQVDEDKVGDQYVGKRYLYDRLVADDKEDIAQYNAQLHPNQKKYPGMSRMDVLNAHMNPYLLPLSRPAMLHMIGNRTETSINRLELKCNNATYRLPRGLEDEAMLRPGDKRVVAYWLPDANGEVNEVHIYQHGRYLFTAVSIATYSRATVEWTGADQSSFYAQAGYVNRFETEVKEMKAAVPKVAILKRESVRTVANVAPAQVMPEPETIPVPTNTGRKSLKDRF